MKRQTALTWFLIFIPGLAFATPPRDVTVFYDVEKSILHVAATHPTDRQSRHYIRTINVLKNDGLIKTVGYSRQEKPSGLEKEISIEVQEGDRIRVELICNQGGRAEAETVVGSRFFEKPKVETEQK